MASRQIYSDEEFMRWCESLKPCKHCGEKFVGPVCECERKAWEPMASRAPIGRNKR